VRKVAPKKASARKPVRKASTPRATAAAKRKSFVPVWRSGEGRA